MNKESSSDTIEIAGRKDVLRRQFMGVAFIAFFFLPTIYIWRTTSHNDWITIAMIGGWFSFLLFLIVHLILQIVAIPVRITLSTKLQEIKLHFNFRKPRSIYLKDISHYTTTEFKDERGIFIYTTNGGRYVLSDRYLAGHFPVKGFLNKGGILCRGHEEYNETRAVKTINNGLRWVWRKLPFLHDDED